jgi:hypothetical protein
VAVSGDYNTSQVTENTNLYFTNARAIASTLTGYTSGAGTITSSDSILSAIQKLNGNIGALTTGVSSVNGLTGAVTLTTSNIAEGTNLYYTEARVNANTNVAANTAARHNAVTIGTANGLSLSTQVLSLGLASTSTTGALSSTDWNTFNNKTSNTGTVTSVGLSSATSGVTIGSTPITTSGTITLAIATASGSQQGLLSSTDWTTFNNKQNALTNPVTGTGTTNYLPKFTGASTIGNSAITDDGTTVTLVSRALSGTSATFSSSLTVQGNGTGLATLGGSSSGLVNSLILNNTSNTSGSDAVLTAKVGGASGGNPYSRYEISGVTTWFAGVNNAASDSYVIAGDAGIGAGTLLTLNASGNLGLGVTPSAWSTGNTLDINTKGSLHTSGAVGLLLGRNVYYDGSYKYKATGVATGLIMDDGGFNWQIAPSGTAGNAISFTQAMTLDASGRLGIGTTSPDSRLHVGPSNGAQLRIDFVSSGDNYYDGVTHYFRNGNGAANIMTLLNGGNVGIGTASPSSILHIEKASQDNILAVVGQSGYEGALFLSGAGSGKDANIVVGNGRNLEFHTTASATPVVGGTTQMTLTGTGNLEIATGSIKTGEPDTGWGRAAIKIGASVSGAAFDVTRYLPVSVDGTVYYINLNSSTP